MDIQVGEKEMWITQGHHQLFRQILINSHKVHNPSLYKCVLWPACISLASLFYHSHCPSHMTKGSSSLKEMVH